MKKGILAFAIFSLTASQTQAQGWLNVLKNAVGESSSSNTQGNSVSNLSSSDIAAGLRQALEIGAQNASKKLHTTNGFFGDALIKVMMPPEAQNAANTLRAIGLGDVVDKAILSMNRAAEDAAGKAAPIFVDAIKKMSIQDAVGILRGGDGAATDYLKRVTTAPLTAAFRPVIQSSLGKVGATAYWGDLTRIYNQLPTTRRRINEDLTAYVTERALNGLFVNIANEENKIRKDPAARVTDLLNKVFGSK
ncbi:MAG: DUF4197 domain-containing protein [Bacteroidetes bacterium]|nr:DUF4197 domain-containing protein [Bacteroidota bacterium]MBS1630925.1 DUF4197 domain-containing protein [Bacteroidota bacterium]